MADAHLAAPPALKPRIRTVRVRAPGRLHLGFLDPSGSLGRSFGSLGLVIEEFASEVQIAPASADRLTAEEGVNPQELARAAACLALLRQHSGLDAPLALHLQQLLPAHAGLGSGTQLALAIGRAFAQWHALDVDTPQLAQWLGRGLRSGIGIAGFDQGGLLLDGGPGAAGQPAPVLSRLDFPAHWRVIVVEDAAHRGLSGRAEKQALAAAPPLPQARAAEICHHALMQVLPGAARAEFAAFAAGLNRMQHLLGEHYAPVQGGHYTSPAVGRLMDWLADADLGPGAAVGQSSWGPTSFAIVPSQAQAEQLVEAARAAGQLPAQLTLRVVSGRNTGAVVTQRVGHGVQAPAHAAG